MGNINKPRPLDVLAGEVRDSARGAIVLCESSRAAFLVKRALIHALPGKALLNVDVLSATELVAKLTRELGIEARVIGGLGREMLIGEILAGKKTASVSVGGVLTDYARTMGKVIAELIGSGVTPNELKALGKNIKRIGLLREVFQDYLGRLTSSGTTDARELPDRVIEKVSSGGLPKSLRGKKLIRFCALKDTLTDKLERGFAKAGLKCSAIEADSDREGSFSALTTIFDREGTRLAREIARKCKKIVVDSKCGYKDICLVIPPKRASEREVVKALAWAGIPSSDPLWMDLSEHPIASSLISAMRLFAQSGTKLDIFPCCSVPYIGLEHYVRKSENASGKKALVRDGISSRIQAYQRIKHKPMSMTEWADPHGWERHFKKISADDTGMDEARASFYRWTDLMRQYATNLNKKCQWNEHCEHLEAFIKDFYEDGCLLFCENSEPSQASMEIKASAAVADVLSKVKAVYSLTGIASAKVEWGEFAATVEEAFKEKRLMLRGASRDGVGIAEPADVAGLDFRHVIICDASESNFPLQCDYGWLLTEKDRSGIAAFAGQSAQARTEEERAGFFAAVSSADCSLTFAVPSIGKDEKPVNRSIWATDVEMSYAARGGEPAEMRLKRRFPAPLSMEDCLTASELGLMVADFSLSASGGEGSSAMSLKSANESDTQRLASLSALRFNDEHQWSASMMNQYLKCPISFLPMYLSDVRPPEEFEELPSPKSSGSFLHDLIKEAFDKIVSLRDEAPEKAVREIDQLLTDKLKYGTTALSLVSSREVWELLRENYAKIVSAFAAEELIYLKAQNEGFNRHFTELELTTSTTNKRLKVGNTEISFNARIDRIDVDGDDNAAIFDYKSGRMPDRDKDVQVDFYSLIAEQVMNFKTIASLYFPMNADENSRKDISVGDCASEFNERLGLKKPNSRNMKLVRYPLSEQVKRINGAGLRIEDIVKKIRSGAYFDTVDAKEKDCKYCIRKYICWHMNGEASDEGR